jgi:type I restriction enzyme S subunit
MNLNESKKWKTVKLGELATVKGGKRLPLGTDLVSCTTDHPYIRVTDIEDGKIKKKQLQFVPDDVFQKISRYIVDVGDVIVSIVGSVGCIGYIDQDLHKASLTENCVRITEYKKDLDSKFLFWYLISRVGQHDIASKTVGSTQPKLPIYNIRDLEIPLPIVEVQKEIASMLGSLDDKIELLRRENTTLEKMAQTLFKEWFVDFRFPGYEDMKMVNGLPEGWRVGKLSEICLKIASGGTPQTKEDSYWSGNINWFSTKELQDQFLINSEKLISESGLKNSSAKLFPINTVVVAIYAAPTVGRLGILTKESAFNQAACGLIANEEISSFTYIYLLLLLSRDMLNQMANGAAQQNLSVGMIRDFKVSIPSKKASDSFQNVVKPIFEKIKTNTLEIKTLSRVRDELLNKIFKN